MEFLWNHFKNYKFYQNIVKISYFNIHNKKNFIFFSVHSNI